MKKTLISIFFFFLFITKIYAMEEALWTDEINENDNKTILNNEFRYKWYKNIVEYSPEYYVEGENDYLYPYTLYDNNITTEFSEWSEYIPEAKLNREIESVPVGRYRTLRPIRYLFLEDFKGGYLTFKIAELNILIDNQKRPYHLECFNCSFNFKNDVTDGSYDSKAYISNGGSIFIDLGDYYGIEQIRIELYMYDSVPNTKKFKLYYNEGNTIDDRNYAYKEVISYVVSANPNQPEMYLIIPDSSFIVNPVWNEWIYIDGCVNTTYYRQMQFLNLYRFRDVKYRYYNHRRIYKEGYYASLEDNSYIRDDESAKMFYLYSEHIDDEGINSIDSAKENILDDDVQVGNHFLTITDTDSQINSNNNEHINLDNKDSSMIENIPQLLESKKKQSSLDDIESRDILYTKNTNFKQSALCFLVILLLIIIFRLRNHFLSHQK